MHEDRNAVEVHASARTIGGRGASWLVAAVTGRALAQSAARGGHRVVVLDYFADRDCADHAVDCRSVCSARALRFDRDALLHGAQELAPSEKSIGLVYGSGFERRIGLLRKLAAGRELIGNRLETVRLLSNPARFFTLLDQLGIQHPETRLTRPGRLSGWLAKQRGGAGGIHVQPAAEASAGDGTYYQRLEPGRTLSVTFLANGKQGAIIGFNQQWTTSAKRQLPYQFGGAVGGLSLSRRVKMEVAAGLDRLIQATGLIGLNGLDFVLSGDRWSVLEVNPRPTATMELYDPDYPRGLFDWHIRSCRGELPLRPATRRAARALAIVSAAGPWESADDFRLPKWCRDLPRAGLGFSAGDPVCTVHASATTPSAAMTLVGRRQARVEAMLAQSGSAVPA